MPIERQAVPGIGTIFSTKVAFTTTATTLAISATGIKQISPLHVMPVQVSTTDSGDNPLQFTEALTSKGLIDVGTDDTVLLERGASGTSGLDVLATFIGLPSEGRHFITGYGKLLRRTASFVTTAETLELDCGGLDKIRVVGMMVTSSVAYDAQNQLFVDEVSDAKGFIEVPSTGTITIRRPASGGSGVSITVYISDGDTARIPGMGTIFSTKATFSGTGETLEIDAKGYKMVLPFSVIPFGNPVGTVTAVDSNLYVDETLDSRGVMDMNVIGTTWTLRRPGSGSSALPVVANMIGY